MYVSSNPYYYDASYALYAPSAPYNAPYQPYQTLAYPQPSQDAHKGYRSATMAKFVAEFACDCLIGYVPRMTDPLVARITSVLDATRLPKLSVLLGMTYLARRRRCDAISGGMLARVNEDSIFLYVIVALVVANKYNDDNTFTNRLWLNATGIDIAVLNKTEREWLMSCSYDLHLCNGHSQPRTRGFQENRPWILSLATASRPFQPYLNLPLDESYGLNDVKPFANGLGSYYCVEGLYRNYEDAGAYQSPKNRFFPVLGTTGTSFEPSSSLLNYASNYSGYQPYSSFANTTYSYPQSYGQSASYNSYSQEAPMNASLRSSYNYGGSSFQGYYPYYSQGYYPMQAPTRERSSSYFFSNGASTASVI